MLLFCKKRLKSIFGTDRTAAENRPTGFPAGGAFAPYERFAADKTSAQARSLPPSILDQREKPPLGGGTKKKDMTFGHVFLFGAADQI